MICTYRKPEGISLLQSIPTSHSELAVKKRTKKREKRKEKKNQATCSFPPLTHPHPTSSTTMEDITNQQKKHQSNLHPIILLLIVSSDYYYYDKILYQQVGSEIFSNKKIVIFVVRSFDRRTGLLMTYVMYVRTNFFFQ